MVMCEEMGSGWTRMYELKTEVDTFFKETYISIQYIFNLKLAKLATQ